MKTPVYSLIVCALLLTAYGLLVPLSSPTLAGPVPAPVFSESHVTLWDGEDADQQTYIGVNGAIGNGGAYEGDYCFVATPSPGNVASLRIDTSGELPPVLDQPYLSFMVRATRPLDEVYLGLSYYDGQARLSNSARFAVGTEWSEVYIATSNFFHAERFPEIRILDVRLMADVLNADIYIDNIKNVSQRQTEMPAPPPPPVVIPPDPEPPVVEPTVRTPVAATLEVPITIEYSDGTFTVYKGVLRVSLEE